MLASNYWKLALDGILSNSCAS